MFIYHLLSGAVQKSRKAFCVYTGEFCGVVVAWRHGGYHACIP